MVLRKKNPSLVGWSRFAADIINMIEEHANDRKGGTGAKGMKGVVQNAMTLITNEDAKAIVEL